MKKTTKKAIVAMSPYKSLRDSTGQAGGDERRRVVVAMSGGVDSSVAAALLKKQGYEVAGVFMRFWAQPTSNNQLPTTNENLCCSEGAEKAARAVAAKLKIPFYIFNFAKKFKKEVVDYFLTEQATGRTPNPCVVCNKKIKFGILFQRALSVGADFIATGHYAWIKSIVIPSAARNLARMGATESVAGMRQRSFAPLRGAQDDKILYKLFAAKDKNKDQSYFLHQLNQKQLSKIIFPLTDLIKEEVIKLAKKWRLPYRQEESFDLCFVANDAESFIKRHLKLKAGKILRYSPHPSPSPYQGEGRGEVLGRHQGLPLYTIGQRKSILVPQGPWWVIKKDERKNILYVSNNEKDLYAKELIVEKINWLDGQAPHLRQGYGGRAKLPMKVWAKIRYKSEAAESLIVNRGARIEVKFKNPQRAITPGQSAVFYTKTGEVLGGGVIE